MSKTEVSLSSLPFDDGYLLASEDISSIRKVLISNKKVDADHYDDFLTKTFPMLIESLQYATGTGSLRITCTDTIAVWILRANQLSSKNPEFSNKLLTLLNVEILNFLFSYVVDYWNETGAPLSNSLKDLFSKLVVYLKSYSNSQDIFKSWIDKTLTIPRERRVLYYLVEILSKEIDVPSYIIDKDPQFMEKSLQLINSNAVGNATGRALTAVYQRLYVDEDHAEEWFNKYWTPVKQALMDPDLKKGVKSNLLPSLLKISNKAFKLLIMHFEHDPEFYIHLLNIGQQLVIEEDPFPEILSRQAIESLLAQDEFKIEIFRLLTYSPKGSKPVHPETFEIIQDNITQFFADVEVETRNKFLSMLKQFIYRVKDSAYALDRDAKRWLKKDFKEQAEPLLSYVTATNEFLHWLLSYIKSQLRPGSQYQRVISSLNVLTYLVESNLDPSIPYKVSINYPFNISIFDEELVRLLFDNVLSTYDDIRDISSKLLLSAKFDLLDDQKSRIIQKGLDMLNDYTTCDSGAKLLELSYTLFGQDITIFNRLVETIPLNSNILEAVRNPVDGYFNALHLILKHLKTFEEPSKIINIVDRNWENVKEILSHDSPEGCDQYGVGSAQLVLSYGWRSTKESTILINELLRFDLTEEQLLKIGELTLDQLSTVRHRGAFSSVYPTFISLASVAKSKLQGQNKKWLDFNIALIQTKTQLITRRSGGLPYLITAIVTVERDLFEHAFDRLLEIAQIPVDEKEESEKMDIPQVHAFNCIKHLFIESQLAISCAPFIYKALELSLSTFSSKIWSVRNCSIMLFTALQNRLFARKKMSARVFFSRFKGIKEILMNILENSIVDGNLETLFPVLTVLSKLESTPGYNGLEEFKPLLRSCLKTKFWKIRESASRALPALISDDKEESNYLLSTCSLKDQNQLHGHLLAIRVLSSYTEDFANDFYKRVGELLIKNNCFATKELYLQIVFDIFEIYGKHEQLYKILKELFIKDNQEYEIDGSKQLYLQHLSKIVIEYSDDDDDDEVLKAALKSQFYEVKIKAIEYISSRNIHDYDELLQTIAENDDEWTYVRSKAIPLVDNYPISKIFEFATDQKTYGEDIKRSALESLGSVVSKDSAEYFTEYFKLLKLNSDENEPFPIRFSALKSALKYLSTKKNIDIEWIVYESLTDDDDEVRALAAEYFKKGCTPHSITKSIITKFGSDPASTGILLDELLKFNPVFEVDTSDDKVLFVVEKSNFYRSNIEEYINLSRMIKLSWSNFTDGQKDLIKSHLAKLVSKLFSFVKSEGNDDFLGWTTNENTYEEIYGVLFHAKTLGVDTNVVKDAVEGLHFHQSLSLLL